MLSIAILLALLGGSTIVSFASNLSDGDPIPIILTPNNDTPPAAPRGTVLPKIEASYDDELCEIYLDITGTGDETLVVIENVVTEEYACYELTVSSSYTLPFSGTAGTWLLIISLSNGDEYVGSFTL